MSAGGAGDKLPTRRPMSFYATIAYTLWFLPQALLVCLVTRMVKNRLTADTPVFFAYVLFSLAKFGIRFLVYHVAGGGSIAYFRVYWTFALVDAIFVLAVIHELYAVLFGAYQGLTRFASGLFNWAALIMVLVAAIVAASATGSDLSRLVRGIVTLDQSATLVQLGLLTLLFVATSSLWMVWQRSLFGIAIGLTVVVSMELISLVLMGKYGKSFGSTYNWVKSLAYLGGVLTWTSYSVRRQVPVRLALRNNDLRLEEWNATLLKLLGRS